MGLSFSRSRLVPGRTIIPPGTVWEFAGGTLPAGWLLCDGSSKATAAYPALFAAIGYTYGGAGANFNVPDTRGRSVIGVGAVGTNQQPTAALGTVGGDVTNLVNHNHAVTDGGHDHTQNAHGHTQAAHGHTASGHAHGGGGGGTGVMTFGGAGGAAGASGTTYNLPNTTGSAADTIGNTTATNNNTTATNIANTTGLTVNTNGTGATARQPFIAFNRMIKT